MEAMIDKSYLAILAKMRRHERDGHWQAAADAVRAAARALMNGAKPPEERTKRAVQAGGARVGEAGRASAAARCEAAGLRSGDTLRHVRFGVVRATCVYMAPDQIMYAGAMCSSLTAAANAARVDLGLSGSNGGWAFWGLDKKESSTFALEDEPDDVEDDELESEAA